METQEELPQQRRAGGPKPPWAPFGLAIYGSCGLQVVPLPPGARLTIGRGETCELSLAHPALSRCHARFTGRDSDVLVEDLGSRNGTWLAADRIERTSLHPGDAVRLAQVVVMVTFLAAPEVAVNLAEPRALSELPILVPEALYFGTAMRRVHAMLHRLAKTDLPVLIVGETGTGKELAARELHLASARRRGPLRVLNCAAISPQLIESTLFGHERGAFTGADRARAGIFEDANGGTLFLDEVGELSPAAQAALLRVLESHRFSRVGGTRDIDADVRVVAATHRDLHAMAARGEFRVDLLHRLLVLTVELPPLRDRPDEVVPLTQHFLSLQDAAPQIDARALARLRAYAWPGNVRELRNVLARAAVVAHEQRITELDLPQHVRAGSAEPPRPNSFASVAEQPAPAMTLRNRMASIERTEAYKALEQTDGNQRRAAELLGMPLRTFERRLRAWRERMPAAE